MKKHDIVIERVTHLRGPSMWTYLPAIEAWVDIGDLEDFPSDKVPGLYERLESWLPGLIEHRCSPGVRGGFLQRLRRGTWPCHIMEHVCLELQDLAGMPGGFGRARETSKRGVYKVVVSAWHDEVAKASLTLGRDLVLAAIKDEPYDVEAAVEQLRDLIQEHCLGPSTACIVEAANERLIPAIRLNTGNLLQFGYGANARRIWTAETDNTGAIAETISRDKDLTKSLLESCGVPVPTGRAVTSVEDAWDAAEELGLPVVVKPIDGNHGRGVFTNLISREEVEAAYAVAIDEGSGVLVERFIRGDEHRLLIVGGKLAAAAKGRTASVTGDGRSTIAELIESQINADPRRGRAEDQPLNFIRLDSAARIEIARQGMTEHSIPDAGREVLIQRNGNVAFDCTDAVHPDVADVAATAARIVGLDIAGIDLVAQDISRPLQEQGGAIVEVNAGPGLLMHLKPAEGTPRQVGRDIVAHTFPPGDMARIPVIGITGTQGNASIARLIFWLLGLHGWRTGLACSDGLFVGRRQLRQGDCATFDDGRRLLLNREVQAAIIENDGIEIITDGLCYERCEVGIVTAIGWTEDLAEHDLLEADDLIKVYRTQIDVVLPTGSGVLNADDSRVADLAQYCDGAVIYYTLNPQSQVVTDHLTAGKRAVLVENGRLTLAEGTTKVALCEVAAIPAIGAGLEALRIQNVLATAAAAWALGLSTELIEAGLLSYGLNETALTAP